MTTDEASRKPAPPAGTTKRAIPRHTPTDKSASDVKEIEQRTRQRERSDVGEAGTPSK